MDNIANPIIKNYTERPRGLTNLTNTVNSLSKKLIWACSGIGLMCFVTLGMVIVGNELTKEITVSDGALTTTSNDPLAVYQAVSNYDVYDLMLMEDPIDVQQHISSMNGFQIDTGDFTNGYTIDAWSVNNIDGSFVMTTTNAHEMSFNGTHLNFDEMTIATLEEENDDGHTRKLQGWKSWKKKIAKKVKAKLDSPFCNTEALVDKFRDLKFVTAPACHVGVSAAKIYIHYTS